MKKVEQIKKLEKQLEMSLARNKYYRDRMEAAENAINTVKDMTDAILYELIRGKEQVEIPKPVIGNHIEVEIKGESYVIKKA